MQSGRDAVSSGGFRFVKLGVGALDKAPGAFVDTKLGHAEGRGNAQAGVGCAGLGPQLAFELLLDLAG